MKNIKEKKTGICESCGKEFDYIRNTKRFCNKKCKSRKLDLCKCGRKKLITSHHCKYCHKGFNVPNFLGDKIGYKSLHSWIKRNKPKTEFCEICHKKGPKEVSNVSGKYKRNINDYRWVCISCHRIFDWKGRKKWDRKGVIKFLNDNKRLSTKKMMNKYKFTLGTIYELRYRFKKYGGTTKVYGSNNFEGENLSQEEVLSGAESLLDEAMVIAKKKSKE